MPSKYLQGKIMNMNKYNLDKALHYLQREIDVEHIPGAVLYVSYEGVEVCKEALGFKAVYPEKAFMDNNTIFDLASLTKVVATLPSVMKLIEEGQIHLHDSVSHYIPRFAKEDIKIIHLLTHSSGLTADRPFHLDQLSKQSVIDAICEEEVKLKPNEKVIYSDLGMIILFHIIEKITDQSFEEYVQREIFEPLDMHETMFNPSIQTDRFAATEYCNNRKEYKRGIVHDEKADSIGGVSGHAGLFSTVTDLAKYASMIENDGMYRGKQFLSKAVVQLTRRNFTPHLQLNRGLGWDLKSLHEPSSCGDLFSSLSYGHTGFTGTSLWFDSQIRLHVILLTNRVHFGRLNHIQRIRSRLHNIIRSYF
jgi:CubicO group peptidase (beta-lactamase class C family)